MFLFPQMRWKLKGTRFKRFEKIQAQSQDVMKILTQIISSSAYDHVNPAGISVLTQKWTTSKEMDANKNFEKWLS
jgi:hypothetical protein